MDAAAKNIAYIDASLEETFISIRFNSRAFVSICEL